MRRIVADLEPEAVQADDCGDDRQADERQVHVAVRAALDADLNQADRRHLDDLCLQELGISASDAAATATGALVFAGSYGGCGAWESANGPAERLINELNEKYSTGSFFLFHRPRRCSLLRAQMARTS